MKNILKELKHNFNIFDYVLLFILISAIVGLIVIATITTSTTYYEENYDDYNKGIPANDLEYHEIGNLYYNNSNGSTYILSKISLDECVLIDLNTGVRYTQPVITSSMLISDELKSNHRIHYDDFLKCVTKEHVNIKQFNYIKGSIHINK